MRSSVWQPERLDGLGVPQPLSIKWKQNGFLEFLCALLYLSTTGGLCWTDALIFHGGLWVLSTEPIWFGLSSLVSNNIGAAESPP